MKKILLLFTTIILLTLLVACNNSKTTIRVTATARPHAEILEHARQLIKDKGFDLEIIITDDYYIPNKAVASKSVDANFFQHEPFLNLYNSTAKENEKIVNVANIHIEPIGIYTNKYKSLSEIENGTKVIASNSAADHGRLLKLLAEKELITLKTDVTNPTVADITANPKQLVFELTVSPELLALSYKNDKTGSLYLINGNYALSANLDPKTDAIALESAINNPYTNLVGVLCGNENSEKTKVLIEALTSQTVKDFITAKYSGTVIPV